MNNFKESLFANIKHEGKETPEYNENDVTDGHTMSKITGRIHSTESFGCADGPGVRFVVFMQGCTMRCRYCHNPDTWDTFGGTERTADDVLSEALRYRSYWGDSGGITVSGGEPMLQMDFVTELFRLAAREGVSCVLDTSGALFRKDDEGYLRRFDKMMENCSLAMLDIKHIDPRSHKALTGHTNENILAMARYLSEIGKPMWIRYVLVPGINDSDDDAVRCGDFIGALKTVKRVEVLPYHSMGEPKWKAMGLKYSLSDTNPPDEEVVSRVKRLLCGGK